MTILLIAWRNELARWALANLWARLLAEESGQDLIEYALIMVFLAFGSVATMKGVATSLSTFFEYLGNTLTSSV